VGAVGNDTIVVGHAVRLVWRRELGGPNIGFVNFDILEELQGGVSKVVSDGKGTTNAFKWVSRWLPVFGHGVGILLHSSVTGDCFTVVAGEVVLMEMR